MRHSGVLLKVTKSVSVFTNQKSPYQIITCFVHTCIDDYLLLIFHLRPRGTVMVHPWRVQVLLKAPAILNWLQQLAPPWSLYAANETASPDPEAKTNASKWQVELNYENNTQ